MFKYLEDILLKMAEHVHKKTKKKNLCLGGGVALNGVANNKLKKADQAIEILEMGLDYLFDDSKMECNFYQQLTISHTLKGDLKKVKMYQKKVNQLSISNQKNDD